MASAAADRGPARTTLVFLGTRGEIELRTQAHARHSALLVDAGAGRVIVDCGRDWSGALDSLSPAAILLTHAHPDHAAGLRAGAPCPVYGTEATWHALARYQVRDRHLVEPRRRFEVCALAIEAFPVEHSLRAPAVGYRISAGGAAFLYVPDVVAIVDPRAALAGLALYIGDGASVARSILRRRDGRPIGHASMRVQLGWCAAARVPRAVFTHCGSQVVRGHAAAAERLAALGRELGVDAGLATDGMELVLSSSP